MEWESNSELHPPGAEVDGVKTGGGDKNIEHTSTDETRHLDDQVEHTEKAEISRDDPAFLCEIKEFTSRN